MRVAVVLVWRPKYFPSWEGRSTTSGSRVPTALAHDRSAAPYAGTHIASLLPRDWEVTLVHEMVRDVDLEMDVDAVFLSTMDFCAPHARSLARAFRARGVQVVVGGLYPTLNPGYFAGDATVVIGEAEPVNIQRLASPPIAPPRAAHAGCRCRRRNLRPPSPSVTTATRSYR